jgi:preprotein translocase subunit SecG
LLDELTYLWRNHMEWLKTLFVVLQVVSALAIIGLVLIQQGKGADMGAAFGSGSSGSVFGASGSANFLSRTTAVFAVIFFVSTLGITWLGSKKPVESGVLSNSTLPAVAPTQQGNQSVPAPAAAGGTEPAKPVVPK